MSHRKEIINLSSAPIVVLQRISTLPDTGGLGAYAHGSHKAVANGERVLFFQVGSIPNVEPQVGLNL